MAGLLVAFLLLDEPEDEEEDVPEEDPDVADDEVEEEVDSFVAVVAGFDSEPEVLADSVPLLSFSLPGVARESFR